MSVYPDSTLTADEAKAYQKHMEKNARYERDAARRMQEREQQYRRSLEKMILEDTDNFTSEELGRMSIRRLESMYDNSNYYNPKRSTDNNFKVYFEFCEGIERQGIRAHVGEKMGLTEFNKMLSQECARSLYFQDRLTDNLKKYFVGQRIEHLSEYYPNIVDAYKNKNVYEFLNDYKRYELSDSEQFSYFSNVRNYAYNNNYPVFCNFDKAYWEIQLNGETIDGGKCCNFIGGEDAKVDLRKESIFDGIDVKTCSDVRFAFPGLTDNQATMLAQQLCDAKMAYQPNIDVAELNKAADSLFHKAFRDVDRYFDAVDRFQHLGAFSKQKGRSQRSVSRSGRGAMASDERGASRNAVVAGERLGQASIFDREDRDGER